MYSMYMLNEKRVKFVQFSLYVYDFVCQRYIYGIDLMRSTDFTTRIYKHDNCVFLSTTNNIAVDPHSTE